MPIYRFMTAMFAVLVLLFSGAEVHSGVEVKANNSDQSSGQGIQYYVDPAGDDGSGEGTFTNPWKTIHHAVAAIGFGENNVTLNLRAGTYLLVNTLVINGQTGGSKNGRFTIRSHEGENAVLDGSYIPEFGAMVSITNASSVTLENLELTNLVGNKSGIHVTGASSDIVVSNNTIHDMQWTTDPAAAKAPTPSDNLNPVVIVGDNLTPMKGITVSNNKLYNLTTGYSEAIKIVGNIDGFVIEKNEVYDISNIGIVAAGNYAWVGLQDARLNHARNGVIRNNEVYRCVSPIAASAGIYVDGARDIRVTDNYSHHNTVGFSVGSEQPGEASGIILKNNVAADNTQAGVVIGTISANSMVANVTLTENELRGNYTSPVWGGAPVIINKSKNISIEENEIQSISQYMVTVNATSDGLSLNRNRYESSVVKADQAIFSWLGINKQNHTGFKNYQSATGQDAQSKFTSGGGIIAEIWASFKSIFSK